MRNRIAVVLSITAILALVLTSASLSALLPKVSSTDKGNGADWPRYTGDLAGSRFSTLKEINTSNVSSLAPDGT
jgi:glucose dehydrogenase